VWIVGSGLILSLDGVDVTVPTQPRLMHPAQAVHDLASLRTARDAALFGHASSVHGPAADYLARRRRRGVLAAASRTARGR
jgi:hypothetical protein